MKKALLISLIGCFITTGIIVMFSEVHKIKENKLNDKLKIVQDSLLINKNEMDSLGRLYRHKPRGFRQLVKDIYTTYGMQLRQKEFDMIINKYSTNENELEWIQNFYSKNVPKRLTNEIFEYIQDEYLGYSDSLREKVFLNKIKSEHEIKSNKVFYEEKEIKNLNSKLSKSYPIKSYLIIEIVFWLLIFMPILFIILTYKTNGKETVKH